MLFFLSILGCQSTINRAAWLKEQLYLDNRIWLQRDEDLLSDKFRKMSEHPYNFMRGTVPLYYAELTRIESSKEETSFLRSSESTAVPLFGDPHPENASVLMRDDGSFDIEFVDLDSAVYGPWTFDLRRSATAMRLLMQHLEGCDARCEDEIIVGLVSGFTLAYTSGERYPFEESTVWSDYLDEAAEEGFERKKFYKYTAQDEREKRFIKRSEGLDDDGEGILDISTLERAQVERLAERFSTHHSLESFRILDVTRKYGTGISSRPAIRYVILWDQGGEGDEDDVLTQFREILDPPILNAVAYRNTAVFEHNADRINRFEDMLWVNPSSDPFHRGFWDDGHGFKSVSWNSWLQDIELHKLVENWGEGNYSSDDMIEFSESIGWMLGHVHHQNRSLNDRRTHEIVLTDIEAGGGWTRLEAEIKAHSTVDASLYQSDFELFNALIEQDGALLGFDSIEEAP